MDVCGQTSSNIITLTGTCFSESAPLLPHIPYNAFFVPLKKPCKNRQVNKIINLRLSPKKSTSFSDPLFQKAH